MGVASALKPNIGRPLPNIRFSSSNTVLVWGKRGREGLGRLDEPNNPIVLINHAGCGDPSAPVRLARRQHKQNGVIACILSREKYWTSVRAFVSTG